MARTAMGTVTLKELRMHILNNVEETEFLELLDITTSELIEAFDDKIADRFDYLVAKLELDEEDDRPVDSDDSD